ncbi:MAG: hypothetical protein JST30_07000 [Armatimonadetes bacterium]|nr:hypothetical protein [Armatimonadota bacterium]
MVAACTALLLFRTSGPLVDVKTWGPARDVVRRLATASGQNLTVSPELAWEPLVLRLKGASVVQVKSRLATALDAEWTVGGDGEVLRPSEAVCLARRTAEAQDYQDKVRAALAMPYTKESVMKLLEERDRAAAAWRPGKGIAESVSPTGSLMDNSPRQRLAMRLILSVAPAELAASTDEGRSVFAASPTARQHGFERDVEPALTAFREEVTVWEQAGCRPELQADVLKTALSGSVPVLEFLRQGPIGSSLVSVRWKMPSGLYQPTSRSVVTQAFGSIAAVRNGATALRIGLSGDDKAKISELRAVQSKGVDAVGVEGVLKLPDGTDLFDRIVSRAMISVAERQKLNLVAVVPDSMRTSTLETARQGFPLSFDFTRSADSFVFVVSSDGTWTTFRPSDPTSERKARVPRHDAYSLSRKVFAGGSLDVAPIYDFAAKHPDVGPFGRALYIDGLMKAVDPYSNALHLYSDWQEMSLIGMLSADRGHEGRLTDPRTSEQAWRVFGSFTSELRVPTRNGGAFEPTDAFSDGFGDAALYLTRDDRPTLLTWSKIAGEWMCVRETRTVEIALEQSGRTSQPGSKPISNRYSTAKTETVSIVLKAQGREYPFVAVRIRKADAGARPVLWKKLPATVVAEIQSHIDRLKK